MNDKIKRFAFYNIFFLCALCSLFIFLKIYSFADNETNIVVTTSYANNYEIVSTFYLPKNYRYCIYRYDINRWLLFGTYKGNISVNQYWYSDNGNFERDNTFPYGEDSNAKNKYFYIEPSGAVYGRDVVVNRGDLYIFSDLNDVYNYLDNGVVPDIPFDKTLKLDSFKVTSWQIGTSQLVFRSKFEVKWSDDRIANVQVRIVGTANSPETFEGNTSPFKQKFYADNYVMKNGDVIHFTATPYKSNGEYGESLYYSLVYNDNLPSNWYRKLVNTPYNDNTLTIPYYNVSGQPQSVTLPVDGVTTQNVYKVNYNPVTNEYGDLNLYNIYYSPVVVYPDDTPEDEIDETQDVVNNTYTTNNYYETTKNFNIDFDVSFGDISGSDIQIGYDNTGNFFNLIGNLISKLSTWVLALFPFLPPIVATSIVVVFGLVISVAIIAFALKIASVIADFIDAIIPG